MRFSVDLERIEVQYANQLQARRDRIAEFEKLIMLADNEQEKYEYQQKLKALITSPVPEKATMIADNNNDIEKNDNDA
jgi:hypothetical protein